jgi:hypothetical protein
MPCAFGGFPDHGERPVAGYAPCAERRRIKPRCCLPSARSSARAIAVSAPQFAVFAQILGKLNFFKLGENLYRILFDYVEKRANPANATFKRAC